MRITINSKGIEVSDYLHTMIDKKVTKLGRYFPELTEANVFLTIEKSRHIAEITIVVSGTVHRGEVVSGDMYASVDGAIKKIERQIMKHRTKLEKRYQGGGASLRTIEPIFEDSGEIIEDEDKVVKRKTFPTKPMSIEEAILQMDLVGHSFFVFVEESTDEVNVLYKRYDGDLGLLQPEE